MVVKFSLTDEKKAPRGKLADVELHFTEGALQGLRLLGFAVWDRRSGPGRNVTFPTRQYSTNGEKRNYVLLRPLSDLSAQDRLRETILEAYTQWEAQVSVAR